uniref:helix-turn-helix domain-containing protein n=1 Tax=Sphaerisporangium sp. CA-236357 TaxID=3240030 RepID=UPI003F490CB5
MTIIPDQGQVAERLLTSAEVADVFRVDPKTIGRWVRIGRLKAIRTPGGRLRRFRSSDIRDALAADETAEAVSA